MNGYEVTQRGPGGEPQRIRCVSHPACAWNMPGTGAKRDDDPIFVAQFRHHLQTSRSPDAQAFGHSRRSRR